MNPAGHSNRRLSEELRQIAAAAPREAPPETRDALRSAFREHYARMQSARRRRVLHVAALAAAFLAAIGLASRRMVFAPASAPRAPEPTAAESRALEAPASQLPPAVGPAPAFRTTDVSPSPPPAPEHELSAPSSLPPASPSATASSESGAAARVTGPSEDFDFVALPSFDPAVPIDELQLVRVALPGRALSLVGLPVSETVSDRRVVADVLVTQDGRPYAVRFVRGIE